MKKSFKRIITLIILVDLVLVAVGCEPNSNIKTEASKSSKSEITLDVKELQTLKRRTIFYAKKNEIIQTQESIIFISEFKSTIMPIPTNINMC
ncbi:hypothetical protein [Neobacillus niacini]|uniref:hypothetical protein n=1 Tax=Neobacillus niacini TaxID=86668 RepID=UPI002865ACCB|nr:hypothetical protein [Neobacillus niacini]MDR7000199.1 hypothetical protein [Neobacillus niacini]